MSRRHLRYAGHWKLGMGANAQRDGVQAPKQGWDIAFCCTELRVPPTPSILSSFQDLSHYPPIRPLGIMCVAARP